jgi:hypothetical protein
MTHSSNVFFLLKLVVNGKFSEFQMVVKGLVLNFLNLIKISPIKFKNEEFYYSIQQQKLEIKNI